MKTINTQPNKPYGKGAPLALSLLALVAGTALAAPAGASAIWGKSPSVKPAPAGMDALSAKSDAFLIQRAQAFRAQAAARARSGRRALATAASAPVNAILQLSGPLTAAQTSQIQAQGATVTQQFTLFNAVEVQAPTGDLNALAALSFVKRLSLDATVQKYDSDRDEDTRGHTGADTAAQQYGMTGSGVLVAVLDSGVDGNTDFDSRLYNYVSVVPGDSTMGDQCGHGTHVAGIVGCSGAMSTGPGLKQTFTGIAPGAGVVNIRVLDGNGQGTVSTVINGIQAVLQAKHAYNYTGPVVLNLSLGHPVGESYTTDPLCQAVEAAWKDGIVVICAAGNDGRANAAATAGAANEGYGAAYGSINSPGNDPYVITVGAMKSTDGVRADDRIATYSSRGPSAMDMVMKPDIVAPGNLVVSLRAPGSLFDQEYGGTNTEPLSDYAPSSVTSSNYFVPSGTSMATPVVAGAAALMLQKDPTLSPDTIKARLMVSADKWASPTGQYDPLTYGAGYLDIPAALSSTVTLSQPALSPLLTRDGSGNVVLVTSRSVVWGKSVWNGGAVTASTSNTADLSSVALYGE